MKAEFVFSKIENYRVSHSETFFSRQRLKIENKYFFVMIVLFSRKRNIDAFFSPKHLKKYDKSQQFPKKQKKKNFFLIC